MYTWQGTCTGIKSFSTLLAVTIIILCYLQRASCAPLVRRSADNPGGSNSTNLDLIVHTINLRTNLHRLLTNYKSDVLQGDNTRKVSASRVTGIDEPVPNFSGSDSCNAGPCNDILTWINFPRAFKSASHNDTLRRFRKFMNDIPTLYEYEPEVISSFLRDGGDALFQEVIQEIDNVLQELNSTEILSENSRLKFRISRGNSTTCVYGSSTSSSSSSDSELGENYEVLYILQEFNVYATGALSTIYMNDEVTRQLVTRTTAK